MLTAIRIGNFKAVGATQRVPLRPITLLFGPNSAGKSSFLHGLALAHEALREEGRFDLHRTRLGGSSIDLGGFRQYVFRHEVGRAVEWGLELDAARMHGRLAELMAPVSRLAVGVTIGMPLDAEGRPERGAEPAVATCEVEADGTVLLRMSRRRDGTYRLDRLARDHAVFRRMLKAMAETATTTEGLRPEDEAGLSAAIDDLLSTLIVRGGALLPGGLTGFEQATDSLAQPLLFPVSRGSRAEDLAAAVRFWLPRNLDELLRALGSAVAGELARLQYLGPLRSYPPRHLAFSEHEDLNWHAGGGYAWDVVRRDARVRDAVNAWLGSVEGLHTRYGLVVRDLVPLDELRSPLTEGLEALAAAGSGEDRPESEEPDRSGIHAAAFDPEAEAARLHNRMREADVERLPELVLMDRRTNTIVSHRDVGIGVSQVLPVLVSAYGSDGKIVAIEQPEIHLHPALQAELGDVFIASALGGRGNMFLLETHSEHLVLRVLRRVRETTDGELPPNATPVRPEDVAVLYVVPTPEGAVVQEIPVTTDGEFAEPWPHGFFPERAKELF